MEFVDGAAPTDRAALDKLGVDRRALAALIAETFNEMIFTHGFVHCDPHAANLVRTAQAAAAAFSCIESR
jgi:aarF domain-containing kinase